MIDTLRYALPHGIELEARVAGCPDRPLLLFLHGFPESAFVWDDLLERFSRSEHGGYRCVAPCLREYPPRPLRSRQRITGPRPWCRTSWP